MAFGFKYIKFEEHLKGKIIYSNLINDFDEYLTSEFKEGELTWIAYVKALYLLKKMKFLYERMRGDQLNKFNIEVEKVIFASLLRFIRTAYDGRQKVEDDTRSLASFVARFIQVYYDQDSEYKDYLMSYHHWDARILPIKSDTMKVRFLSKFSDLPLDPTCIEDLYINFEATIDEDNQLRDAYSGEPVASGIYQYVVTKDSKLYILSVKVSTLCKSKASISNIDKLKNPNTSYRKKRSHQQVSGSETAITAGELLVNHLSKIEAIQGFSDHFPSNLKRLERLTENNPCKILLKDKKHSFLWRRCYLKAKKAFRGVILVDAAIADSRKQYQFSSGKKVIPRY